MAAAKPEQWVEETRHRLELWGEHLRSLQGGGPAGAPSTSCLVQRTPGTAVALDHPVADRMDKVLAIVKQLDPKAYRVLFLLHHSQHILEDVAHIMRISLGQVRNRKGQGEAMVASVWATMQQLEAAARVSQETRGGRKIRA